MDLNRAMIIGNVTRDPELRTTATGQTVCSFGIATNQQWTDAQGQKQQRTEFHNIVAWGKLAEICGQYLGKGRKTYIEGRLQTREWEAPDGQKRQRTEIVADNMIMLDRKEAGAQSAERKAPSMTPNTPTMPAPSSDASAPAAQALDRGVGEQEIRLEDIPF
ncbi:MAG TPA: single-stranded DNA-binding protein [Verrucomicrobiae bacterium]|nr:single-stranded DNA-binding protein [Verrucomicrobiae bacterium]